MKMGWFIPVAILIGIVGTRTAVKSRYGLKANKRARGWWLLVLMAWLPSFCWVMAQCVAQK